MTPHALSLAAGVASGVVGAIEDGSAPRVDTVERLARALGMSPCTLAYGVDTPFLEKDELRAEGFGVRLKQAREARGLSRNKLGQESTTTGQTVANIEDKGRMPTVATAELLAKALNVSACWLAYAEGEMELPPRPPRRRAPDSKRDP